ncbi:uncharacterized protein LOC114163607 [Vigna unguiculata]|uniref:uncharacterized protein LOC114163607 n=1 Tax=Vigna unguiculata TaxID=3917 RepID=UPI001015D3C1|nr:uncharacterized protein LOC114163607 [Vigna unguiculata]
MATDTQADVQVSLKVVVNKETNKVLFAEAEKDFVDVLCSFLTLPLRTIARLVENESTMGPVTIGSLNSLYRSVAALDNNCLWQQEDKKILLHPRNMAEDFCNSLKLNIDDTQPKIYFVCESISYLCDSICCTSNSYCRCGKPRNQEASLKSSLKGFVNDVATFVITDDLIVMPNSMDYSSFAHLQNSGIKHPCLLKEIIVNVTRKKVLHLHFLLEKKPIIQTPTFLSRSAENNSSIKFKLKLVIRKSDGKFLYAQGDKDFADMVLSFLTFPLGGVVRKLGGNSCVGSIDGLYKSVSGIDENLYFMSKAAKNRLVDPCLFPQLKLSIQILPILDSSELKYLVYHRYIDFGKKSFVHYLKADESVPANASNSNFLSLSGSESPGISDKGIVKGSKMFSVTDDLVVAPSSLFADLNLISSLNISFLDVKEKVVTIGLMECLNILNASLTTTSALSIGLRHLIS